MLSSAIRHRGFLALLCTDATIYLSRQFKVRMLDLHGAWKEGEITAPAPRALRQAAGYRLLRRLGRLDIREMFLTPGGSLLGVANKVIFRLRPGETRAVPVLKVADGGRPKGFAATPAGRIFVGEYWGNPRQRPLRIWASADQGETWEVAHTLPAGSAKHIHNLVWDPYRRGFWVLTGDLDGECALLFTGDEFATVAEVKRGGQMFRACHLFCRPEGLYYGTDTEREANWFVFLDVTRGHLEKLAPLPGSCLYGAQMAGQYFISTTVEPSRVNHYRRTALWSSGDLAHWRNLLEFEKDWWPGEYLGFGRIVLPKVQGECPVLVFTALAVKDHDFTTFIIKDMQLDNLAVPLASQP
jgi:hypothetical protein